MTLAMTKKIIHNHAEDDTPRRVAIPDSWAGIWMWALGRHGPVVLFVAATWFLYQDNKVYQKDLLEVAKLQISINAQMVTQLDNLKTSIAAIAEEAKKAHASHQ
jgi:hypothetical protein